jgi:hypothetical protein
VGHLSVAVPYSPSFNCPNYHHICEISGSYVQPIHFPSYPLLLYPSSARAYVQHRAVTSLSGASRVLSYRTCITYVSGTRPS